MCVIAPACSATCAAYIACACTCKLSETHFSAHFSESFVHRFARRPAFVSSEMFPVLLPLSLVLGWDPNRRAGKRSFYNAAVVCVWCFLALAPCIVMNILFEKLLRFGSRVNRCRHDPRVYIFISWDARDSAFVFSLWHL